MIVASARALASTLGTRTPGTNMPELPAWMLITSLSLCVGALVMTLVNLRFFKRSVRDLPEGADASDETVNVCIPARNEAANIEQCVQSVLSSEHVSLKVLVYDDQSTDQTPEILDRLIERDRRVQRVPTLPLPAGWVGKQWACWQLGRSGTSDLILFIDADVRLTPDALRRAVATKRTLNAALLSTFPRQITGTLFEALVVPLIHFILLSYLPFGRMRRSLDPKASAACGQFMLVDRNAYLRVGGHSGCKDSMHDGVKLPRAFRRFGLHTDLFDGTDIASCRMYVGAGATWRGFAKNAYEGLGSITLLVFITLVHLIGHVLPWAALAWIAFHGRWNSPLLVLALMSIGVAWTQRLILARRFRQSLVGVLLHPVGVCAMTLIQWHSFVLSLTGRRGWKGRTPSLESSSTSARGVVNRL